MASVLQANKLITEWLADDPSAEITTIEKSVDGRVTIDKISDALQEYARLFKAGYSSPAQTLTLHRAYPNNPLYAETVKGQDLLQKDPNVVGGPASVEMIDREGHLITTNALSKAFDNYMKNPMTRNVMVMHSDIQVGWALPAYISKSGQIYKSGIGDNTLFFITELRDDTKISKRVIEEIKKSRMKSYSIAGSAIRTENVSGNMFKGEPPYMRVDELELAEVTICEKGVNQGAGFDIIKGSRPTKSCADESCFITKNEDHSHKQETQTMSYDDYKNLLTAREGKSFVKMFDEYTVVYKDESAPLPRHNQERADQNKEIVERMRREEAAQPRRGRPRKDTRFSWNRFAKSSETRQSTGPRGFRANVKNRKPFNWGARQPQADKHKNINRETIRKSFLNMLLKTPRGVMGFQSNKPHGVPKYKERKLGFRGKKQTKEKAEEVMREFPKTEAGKFFMDRI